MQPARAQEKAAAAARVASLLREKDTLSDVGSLASLRERVASFLTTATSTPAVPLEADTTLAGAQRGTTGGDAQQHHEDEEEEDEGVCVELNVVAGVLEEKPLVQREPGCGMGGVLLPTAQATQALQQRAVQEAQAMLGLMNALCTPSSSTTPAPAARGAARPTTAAATEHAHSASEEDEVDIVDADALALEPSSEDDDEDDGAGGPPAQRRRIIELS